MNDDVAGQDGQRRYAVLCEPLRADLLRFAFWTARGRVLVAATPRISYPAPTLADEVISHVLHEPGAGTMAEELTAGAVAEVLDPSSARPGDGLPARSPRRRRRGAIARQVFNAVEWNA